MNIVYSRFNRVFNNIITNSEIGFAMLYTIGNIFFDNTLINNTEHIFGLDNLNLWYSPLRLRGNYWDDYKKRYPDASPRPLLPWCWDTPYITMMIFRDNPFQPPFLRYFVNNDRFPLINPS